MDVQSRYQRILPTLSIMADTDPRNLRQYAITYGIDADQLTDRELAESVALRLANANYDLVNSNGVLTFAKVPDYSPPFHIQTTIQASPQLAPTHTVTSPAVRFSTPVVSTVPVTQTVTAPVTSTITPANNIVTPVVTRVPDNVLVTSPSPGTVYIPNIIPTRSLLD